MRSRRSSSPSPLDAGAADELIDAPPPDDDAEPARSVSRPEIDVVSTLRVCVECGGDPDEPSGGCAHAEVALFTAPRRGVRDAIERLRRAADERRGAERALRTLVTSEFARGRAEFEARPASPPPATSSASGASDEAGEPPPCPRCAERDAAGEPAAPPARAAVRRQKVIVATGQQAFAFAAPSAPAAADAAQEG